MKEYIFVYGLFRDQARNLLGDYTTCGRANVQGTLYKVNEFYPDLNLLVKIKSGVRLL